jgi:hypothetical protein
LIISTFPGNFLDCFGGGVMSEFSLLFTFSRLYIPYSFNFLARKVPAACFIEEVSVRLRGLAGYMQAIDNG